ncbi:MAG: hypothetical protein VKJ02_05285 [Snowella sp.]|nr:hypothetical protein [Snowella sp.]
MTFLNIQKCRQTILPLLISGLIISCSPLNPLGLASQEYTAITELNKIAHKSPIQVKGVVVNIAPFLEGGAYQLQDATGSVWVKTDKPLPPKGVSLSVKGELQYEGIAVGQQQLGETYILEISQEPQSSVVTRESVTPEKPPQPTVLSSPSEASNLPLPSPTPTIAPSSVTSVTPSLPEATSAVPTPAPSVTPIADPPVSAQPLTVNPTEPKQTAIPVTAPDDKPKTSQPKVQPPAKLNLDDRFLPHKSLSK